MLPLQSSNNTQQQAVQGIQGQVKQLTGNHMPGQGRGNAKPVQTTIWIFKGHIPGRGSPTWPITEAEHHPSLVQQVESDRNGHYSAKLPPGEYTIFAQYDEALYLNAFQGDGSYKNVTVTPDQTTQLDLINAENAFF